MTIERPRFVTSLSAMQPFPGQGLTEIAMTGRSNVGKSSVINRLTNRQKLARVSGEPGKTRLINIYNIDEAFLLVDLPGYGFARAPQSEKKKWADMIEGYLSESPHLKRVLQLVDIRHQPTADDQMMVEYLRHYDIPFTVVANKCDKLSRAQRQRSVQAICRSLAVQPWEVIAFSAESGEGREEALALIGETIG